MRKKNNDETNERLFHAPPGQKKKDNTKGKENYLSFPSLGPSSADQGEGGGNQR